VSQRPGRQGCAGPAKASWIGQQRNLWDIFRTPIPYCLNCSWTDEIHEMPHHRAVCGPGVWVWLQREMESEGLVQGSEKLAGDDTKACADAFDGYGPKLLGLCL